MRGRLPTSKIGRTVTEHNHQRFVVEWLRMRGVGVFSVPNGGIIGGRNKWGLLTKMKAEGMLPGAPDLVLMKLSTAGRPVAVEMKSQWGRLSTDQLVVHREMEKGGWVVVVGHGADDAITQLEALGF